MGMPTGRRNYMHHAMHRFLVPSLHSTSTEESAYYLEAVPVFLFDIDGRVIAGDK